MAIERGTVIDGKYEILKEIGRGGMSVVYLAMDNRLNKQWAIKVLQREGIGKNNEVIINKVPDDTELMKKLDHPAIPRIVDIIDRPEEPQIFIVMDYVEGESLDKILDEFGAQPQELVIDWAKQICDTLGYLHSQKPPIIYRDMKPANIMLKPEGNIKLIDFGIAREYKEQNNADTIALGTRGYASPEHFGGRTDARSDIYTLGMTMHHLLTGADPNKTQNYIYAPIRDYNPELSSGLEHIIDKCVAPDPDARYQNCNELMYDLEHYREIDDNFKKKQKKKLLTFIISLGLSIVFLILGFVFNALVNNQYDILAKSTDIEKVNQAIEVDNSKVDAYLNMLSLYRDSEDFGKEEVSAFTNLFDNTAINKSSKEYFDLAYDFGYSIFFNYTGDDSFREKITRSGKYFKIVVENDEKHLCDNYDNAVIYYSVADFYSKYVIKHDDPTEEALEELVSALSTCVDEINKSDGNAYAKARNLKEIMNLVHNYDSPLAYYNIPQKDVSALMKKIYDTAVQINEITVSPDTKNLLSQIIDNYESYSDDLDRAYTNANERRTGNE